MAEINLSEENLRSLEAIQTLISVEDGKEIGLDDALSRILEFYRRFVPYD
jgi:hypothetical protein